MTTYRERREARAARLRAWADGREEKAEAAFGRARELGDAIPFGQPILVGHHSEGRARRDQDRIVGGMRSGIEHAVKAESMRSRADNIEAAAARAIYSDDEDAPHRLAQRIAELEARRDAMKADNAEYRKAHAAELRPLTAFGRDRAMPYPSYELTNLTANIRRQRGRLGELSA